MQSHHLTTAISLIAAQLCLLLTPTTAYIRSYHVVQERFELRVKLLGGLNTKTVKPGDDVTAQVVAPLEYQGDFLEGKVISSKSAGSIKGTASLSFSFHKLFHKGEEISITSTIREIITSKGRQKVDEEGNVTKSTNNVGVVAAGGAAGAGIGAAAGGAKGAGIGAAVGILATILAARAKVKGTNVAFDPESELVLAVRSSDRPTLKRRPSTSAGDSTFSTRSPLPEQPSPNYSVRGFGSYCRLSIPTNWQSVSSNNTVNFSPANGYSIDSQGRTDFGYGVMLSVLNMGSRDLRRETILLINSFSNRGAGYTQQGSSSQVVISGRQALATTLLGKSSFNSSPGTVTVYTTFLKNGSLFYIATVTPQSETHVYNEVFGRILRSIQFYE